MQQVSRLDTFYRRILLTKFFTKGWGPPNVLLKLFTFRKTLKTRSDCYTLVPTNHPITITNEENLPDCRVLEGTFTSPTLLYLPDIIPKEVQTVNFQMLLPLEWPKTHHHRPICIHFAGTGDHYFWRRRNVMAKPLLKHGIAAIILENPYYGSRKPRTQVRSSLHYVSDIFIMGACLILESIALLNWCERHNFGPLGVSGLSMGGHMASLVAANWPKPLVLVPCLSWSTASSVFTEGVMSEAINWDMLQKQYLSDLTYRETLTKSCQIVDSPFGCCSLIPDYDFGTVLQLIKGDKSKGVTPFQVLTLLDSVKEKYNLVSGWKRRDKEAIWLMRGMMDEFTHLKNFARPFDTSLIIAVCAKSDGYVPRRGVSDLEDLWPGCTVKYVNAGHVNAHIWYRRMFHQAIIEGFERARKKIQPASAVTNNKSLLTVAGK